MNGPYPRIRVSQRLVTLNAAPIYEFTFLNYPNGDEPAIDERWQHLVDTIRNALPGLDEGRWAVELVPPQVHGHFYHPRHRVWARLSTITPDVLMEIYTSMVQSQGAIPLVGFTLTIQSLADGMVDEGAGGSARTIGHEHLPAPLRKMGLGCYPRPLPFEGFCGPIALLCARSYKQYQNRPDRMANDAEALARDMGIAPQDNGFMQRRHLRTLVALPDWTHLRIILFNRFRKPFFVCSGHEWVWPSINGSAQSSKEEDPNTICLYEHENAPTNHYYWIQYIRTFLRSGKAHGPQYHPCFLCYDMFLPHLFDFHTCKAVGIFPCNICKEAFVVQSALANHKKRQTEYPPCEFCGKRFFNGADCHRRHINTNCLPQHPVPPGVSITRCENDLCRRNMRSDKTHNCLDWGACRNCGQQFNDRFAKRDHRCALQPSNRFWNPCRGDDDKLVWKSHWFYDFETYRTPRKPRPALYNPSDQSDDLEVPFPNEETTDPSEPASSETDHETLPTSSFPPTIQAYTHAVLAWCVQLVLPDREIADFVRDHELVDSIETALLSDQSHLSPMGNVSCVRVPSPYPDLLSLRIQGENIQSFIYVCETFLHKDTKACSFQPTFWAHNGSKFDVKFVLDYYLNVAQLDLAGATYEEEEISGEPIPEKESDGKWKWVYRPYRTNRNVASASTVGSKIVSLKARGLTFRCTQAHFACALRNLPAMFQLEQVGKGEFPYSLLTPDNWNLVLPSFPSLRCFDIDTLSESRRMEFLKWWVEQSLKSNVPRQAVIDELKAQTETRHTSQGADTPVRTISDDDIRQAVTPSSHIVTDGTDRRVPWSFSEQLWTYLYEDVRVGVKALEAYHLKCIELHEILWPDRTKEDGSPEDRLVSPLDFSTAPAWAYGLYTTWFMPPDTLYLLRKHESKFVRDSLRGGRTDKRANYVEISEERKHAGDRIAYYDFTSLYPSVQHCETHAYADFPGTHFPVGPPSFARWPAVLSHSELERLMEGKTGFLKIDFRSVKYTTHPTLHHLATGPVYFDEETGTVSGDKKLLFANVPVREQTYAWPEIQEALRCGEIEITRVHEALLFDKGTNVFQDYVNYFFMLKDKAEREKNKGLRALAKLLLNSLWGKLGQRSYPVREWVTHKDRLSFLFEKFESGQFVLKQFRSPEANRVWFEYEIPEDFNNLSSTAPQIAAYVSMWGRVILHRKVLSVHGQRVLYCDTDSAIIYLRKNDQVPFVGKGLGFLANEVEKNLEDAGLKKGVDYEDPYISSVVLVAPKTYAYQISCTRKGYLYSKTTHKGFEPSYKNRQVIHYHSMKRLVWRHYKIGDEIAKHRTLTQNERDAPGSAPFIEDQGRMTFVSLLSTNEISPIEVQRRKKIFGTYNKGEPVPSNPCLVKPFGPDPPEETFLSFVNDNKHYE